MKVDLTGTGNKFDWPEYFEGLGDGIAEASAEITNRVFSALNKLNFFGAVGQIEDHPRKLLGCDRENV